jgi:predicted transcriptional regulator
MRIAELMRDGRERTTDDVATRLKADRQAVQWHLLAMKRMGLLTSDKIESSGISATAWRKA